MAKVYNGDMERGLSRFITDLLFPVRCYGCEQEGEWYCQNCLNRQLFLPDNRCAICRKAAKNGLCGVHKQRTGLDGIVALLDYNSPAVRKIIKSKYHGDYAAISSIAAKCARPIQRRLPEREFSYCFVPQSPSQSHSRGFNASEIIANTLADSAPIFRHLKKTKETPHQASLDKSGRQKNLIGAFTLPRRVKAPEMVVICDDLITTGATLSRIAQLLRKRGSKVVWGATIAHD